MRFISLASVILFLTGAVLSAQPVQPERSGRIDFVAFGRVPGAIYHPSAGTATNVGVVYSNGGNSMTSSLCAEVAKRGFLVVCTPGPDVRGQGGWETVAVTVKDAVLFLREQAGIDTVVLYGHSGGGAVASFYQAVAENGVAFCQDPKKLSRCPDSLANLPPADAVVFPDAHPGLGVMAMRNVNPSVVIDGDPPRLRVIEDLDPFNPANGYKPNGSRYPLEFQERFAKAQAASVNALIDRALSVRERAMSGRLEDPSEDIVMIPASGRIHLDQFDPTVVGTMSTEKPRKLLKNDGTVVTQIIRSVAAASSAPPGGMSPAGNLLSNTVAHFLSCGSVRATDSISAIDYCTSNSVTACNVGYIHVPVLFIASGASSFIADSERMYERSPAKDKDFIVVEGADHSGNPCTRCESTPGQYSNSSKNMFGYITKWINDRFPAVKSPAH